MLFSYLGATRLLFGYSCFQRRDVASFGASFRAARCRRHGADAIVVLDALPVTTGKFWWRWKSRRIAVLTHTS